MDLQLVESVGNLKHENVWYPVELRSGDDGSGGLTVTMRTASIDLRTPVSWYCFVRRWILA
jgi:hypothetical protein